MLDALPGISHAFIWVWELAPVGHFFHLFVSKFRMANLSVDTFTVLQTAVMLKASQKLSGPTIYIYLKEYIFCLNYLELKATGFHFCLGKQFVSFPLDSCFRLVQKDGRWEHFCDYL